MSKIQALLFIMINLLVLLIISWGYIYFRIKKTTSNEVLISGKIQQLKDMFAKHKKNDGNTPIAIEEFKLQQECIASLQLINQQQQDAMAEIEGIENNDSLDQETKGRYIKAQLASLKAQSDAYEDTVSILRNQIRQGNNRLTFIEEKLLIQKQELIELRLMRDKSEMDNLHNNLDKNNSNNNNLNENKANTESEDSTTPVENQENDNSTLNEMSVTITQQKEKIENQNSELEQLMQGYLILEEESKNATTADNETDIDMTSITDDISEIELALERALTEKNFLETQFLDLLDSSDNQVQLKDELKRTKTEYMMLEEHFIDLAEKK